jgi:S1-C subfamily serine protease
VFYVSFTVSQFDFSSILEVAAMSHDPWSDSPPPIRRRPISASPWVPLISFVFFVALAIGSFVLYRAVFSRSSEGPVVQRAVTPRGDLIELEKTNIRIYKEARASVVHITTLAVRSELGRLQGEKVPEGTGSGFFWDDEGHIVTNYHVIRNAQAAQVTLSDQTTYAARYIGGAQEKDLAVLKIVAPRDKLRPVVLGTSEDLQVGQLVYAIGNPFGLDQTLTTGVVSALGREIASDRKGFTLKDVIQTDAAINPGNSGGPLLDSAGRLIGVNTAIYSPSGSSAGIGFAIPVDEVNRVVPQLIKHGKITRPGLGVQVASDELAKRLGAKGALLTRVVTGSAAHKAGLKASYREADGGVVLGDAIVAVDGRAITKVNDLFRHLERYKVGEKITVRIVREQAEQDVEITLGAVE